MPDASLAGKVVAGCSGCLVALLLVAIVGFSVFAASTPNVSADEAAPIQAALSTCCCLSGVGLIAGIVLLLVGRRSTESAG